MSSHGNFVPSPERAASEAKAREFRRYFDSPRRVLAGAAGLLALVFLSSVAGHVSDDGTPREDQIQWIEGCADNRFKETVTSSNEITASVDYIVEGCADERGVELTVNEHELIVDAVLAQP